MQTALLALLLTILPMQASDADRCDSLYAVAKETRAAVTSGLGKARTTPEEQQQWRQKMQRLQREVEQARSCYDPLLPPDEPPPPRTEERSLPAPSSTLRQRLMQTYRWSVFAHRELQQYEAAFQEYDAFFQRFGTAPDSSRIAFMHNSRGYLHYRLGNLTEAINDYTRTIAYTPAADTVDRAALLIDLGTILQKVNDLHAAQHNYAEAERLMQNIPASDRRRELKARALFNQGDILLQRWPGDDDSTRTARYRRATDLLQQAIALHPDGEWSKLARAHIALGEAYRLTNDLSASFRHLQKGRELGEALDAPEIRQADMLAFAALARGKTEIAANRLDAASASFNEAVRFAALGNNHHHRLQALQRLGALYERRGNVARAETYYRRAIDVTETLRASLRATDWATAAFAEWAEAHRGLVRVHLARGHYREAFRTLERTRARHLQDIRLQARITSTLSPAKRVRFDSLTTALRETRTQLAQSDLGADATARLQTKESKLTAQRRSLVGLEDDLAPPRLENLHMHLQDRQQTLISYFIDDPASGQFARSHAFVVTPDSLHAIPLSVNQPDLEAALPRVSAVLDAGMSAESDISATRFDLTALHRLHERLIAPLTPALPSEGRLAILPDGPLFRLPFGMLVAETPGRFAYDEARYLIEDHPTGTELGTALLADTTDAARSFRFDLLALGQTEFTAATSLPPTLLEAPTSVAELSALPGVDREMQALNRLFGQRRVLLDEAATEATFYELQSEAKVLHLASHALVDETHPRNNLFVLAPDAHASGHDGLLFLHELEGRRTPIPLVVLSGCSTARGLHRSGEGPLGLQYAFRAMGAQSTLSTLWGADDESAVALTSAFYRHLQDGAPKDVALQRAQMEVIRTEGAEASPFFWAAPVLYGDPRPLDLTPAPNYAGYVLGVALLLLLIGGGYTYRRWG